MLVRVFPSLESCFYPHFVCAALLDDLDKELNNYIMRCREWYGWHFPEIGKIVTDNLAYCKTVRKIGALAHSSPLSIDVILSRW